MKGLYSNTNIVGNVFTKEYDVGVNISSVSDEYDKAVALNKIFENDPHVIFPKPINVSRRVIKYEKVEGFVELKDYLIKYNREDANSDKILFYMGLCGEALGRIHNELKLVKGESLGWKIAPLKKAYLFSDFGIRNILIKDDKIVLIDPSFNLINDKVCLYDSVVFDIAYFFFSIKYLIPLKNRKKYELKYIKYYVNTFLSHYYQITKTQIPDDLLRAYEDKVKEVYIKNYVNKLNPIHRMIWKKILTQEAY